MKKFRIGSGLQNFHIRTPLIDWSLDDTRSVSFLRSWTRYAKLLFCKQIRNPTKFTAKLQIILQIILTKYCEISATCFSLNDLLSKLCYLNWFGKIRHSKVEGPGPPEIKVESLGPCSPPGSANYDKMTPVVNLVRTIPSVKFIEGQIVTCDLTLMVSPFALFM